jgi:TolB-like protein
MTKNLACGTLLVSMLLWTAGCAGHRGAQATFHDPNMDFGLIRSVAVLPFDNLTTSAQAGGTSRDVFMTLLQAKVDLYVIPPGEIQRSISRTQPEDPVRPTAEEVIKLAANLGADVVITGTVLEFGQVRSGSATSNVCSLSVKMLEGQTGRVVWSASTTRGGISAGDRLVGSGGQPMNVVVSKAADDLVGRLFQ